MVNLPFCTSASSGDLLPVGLICAESRSTQPEVEAYELGLGARAGGAQEGRKL